jgi:hypothetical protein
MALGLLRMRGKVSGCVLVIVLSLVGAAPCWANGPSLVNSVTIAGQRTGYVEVQLPEPLDPFDENEPTIAFEGGGGILGVVLRARDLFGGYRRPNLKILRLDRRNEGSRVLVSLGDGQDGALPPGRYRLYLITDGPGRVSLDFPGWPEGELSLVPEVATPYEAGPLPERQTPTLGTTVFGRSAEISSAGLVFARAIAEQAPAGSRLELCTYRDSEEEQAGSSAYGPKCPGGRSSYAEVATATTDMGIFSLSQSEIPGRFGEGGNFSLPVPLGLQTTKLETFGMWTSYEPPGTPVTPGQIPSQPLFGTATFTARRLFVRGRTSYLPLACTAEGPCRGSARLSGASRRSRFSIPAGRQRTVRLSVKSWVARRIARGRIVRARLVVSSEVSGGQRQERGRVTLVRAPRKKR